MIIKVLADSFPSDIKSGNYEDDALRNETEGFKKFINAKGLKISNENIEDVPTDNYRIYKDLKFIVELKDVCDKNDIDYTDLITD